MQMNTKVVIFMLAIASLVSQVSYAGSANSVVLSTGYSAEQSRLVRDHLLTHLLTSAPSESTWWLVNGTSPATICEPFVIPTLKVNNPEARKRALANTLTSILVWFGRQTQAVHHSNNGLIDLPRSLDFIATHKLPGPMTVYVLANPLYLPVNRDVPFSFEGGRYPARAHLYAGRDKTPFSLERRGNQLQDIVVNFNYLSESVFPDDGYRVAVESWWQSFIEGQRGALGLFDSSLKDFFATKTTPIRAKLGVNLQKPDTSEVVMLVARPPEVGQRSNAPATNTVSASFSNATPPEVTAMLERWNTEFDRLMRAQDFCALVERFEQARTEVPARYQPTNWCARSVEALLSCADTLSDRATRRAKYKRALALAHSCSCPTNVPSLKLSLMDLEDNAAQDRAITEYTSLLQAGDAVPMSDIVPILQNKLVLYRKAQQVAEAHELSQANVQERILGVQEQLDKLLVPAPLPLGSQAEVTRVSTEQAPYVFLDVSVTGPAGEPVRGLDRKDFRISFDGLSPKAVQVASVRNQPPLFYLVLCLDESQSMSGKPISATITAAKKMLAGLASNDRLSVQVLAFSDKVRVLIPWTTNKLHAASVIDGLKAKGGTALYDAAKVAVDALKVCDGERRLLIFSDGQDTASRLVAGPEALENQLREAEIESAAIGLHLSKSDQKLLRRLAGHYLDAGSPEQLQAAFKDASRLVREVYRFVITPNRSGGSAPQSFQVTVGGTNAVVAKGFDRLP